MTVTAPDATTTFEDQPPPAIKRAAAPPTKTAIKVDAAAMPSETAAACGKSSAALL
ncbi:hypothetical protein [Microbacterium marmarense]|uniref:Uncharacterized protein n=1 Tax=Microbacterium marmarense TaxID=3122051 RepID=A0ABU8LSG0_9MICO